MFGKILINIFQPILVLLLLVIVKTDEGGKTLITFEHADLLVQNLYLLSDILLYGVSLFLLVDCIVSELLLYLFYELYFVFLKNLLYFHIDFLLTIGQLLVYILLQALSISYEIILSETMSTFFLLHY